MYVQTIHVATGVFECSIVVSREMLGFCVKILPFQIIVGSNF
jgi:hypothetical protein